MIVWLYFALLLIAIGTASSSTQITPSCNQVHLFINTNSYEHTPTCQISSKTEHTHAARFDGFSWPPRTKAVSSQRRDVTLKYEELLHNTLLEVALSPLDFSFQLRDFSQRAFLHSSQGRSRPCLLRHSSLLSGLEGLKGVLWEGEEHVMLTWVVKAWTYLGKMPLYTLSHPLLFFRFLCLSVGIPPIFPSGRLIQITQREKKEDVMVWNCF